MKHPILAHSPEERTKFTTWIETRGGIRVWVSHDLGAQRPDVLTPADRTDAPHWAYPLSASTVLGADDVTFYEPDSVVETWSQTPAGDRAAQRALEKLPDETRTAPGGTWATTYTILHFQTTELGATPGSECRVTRTDGRPLFCRYLVGILRWSAKLTEEGERSCCRIAREHGGTRCPICQREIAPEEQAARPE